MNDEGPFDYTAEILLYQDRTRESDVYFVEVHIVFFSGE